MKYLCLAYGDEKKRNTLSKTTQDTLQAQDNVLSKSGHMVAAVQMATTVRFVNGKARASDGTFAQSNEHLAGFYLIEAKNLNEVIKLISKTPCARVGAFEVRPIDEIEQT